MNKLIESFFTALNERTGMDIAMNTSYNYGDAKQRLFHKFNVKNADIDYKASEIDEIFMHVCRVDGQVFGITKDDMVYTLDSKTETYEAPEYEDEWEYDRYGDKDWVGQHATGRTIEKTRDVYQVNSVLDKKDPMYDFVKSFKYLESEEAIKDRRAASKAKSDEATAEFEKAAKIFHVNITDGTYKSAADFYDDCDDEGQSFTDDEAEFEADILMGTTPLGHYTIPASLEFSGSCVTTHYERATYWDPEERSGTTTIDLDEVNTDYDIIDEDGNEVSVEELAEKIPEGMFKNLFIKYIKRIINNAVDNYIPKDDSYYEEEWG